MSEAEIVIDADGHVLEPADTWEKYIEQGFIDTVNYNLKLMDDGRLLIVPTDKLGCDILIAFS